MIKSRYSRQGFTLTELLVVIVIIAVLATIGFAVGRRVLTAAKAAKCTNNLRQMALSVTAIRQEGVDNKGKTPPGYFPPYGGYLGPPSWARFIIWDLVGQQAGFCALEGKKFVWNQHPSETFLQNPLSEFKLADGVELSDVDLNEGGQTVVKRGGFGYNHHLEGWTDPNSQVENKTGYKRQNMNIIRHPELTIMMGEQQKGGMSGAIIGPNGQAPHGNYKDSAHCAFVDGHIERLGNEYLASDEAKEKNFLVPGIR